MAVTGTGGAVKISTNKVAEIENWSLDLGADDIDITSFDSNGWKEYLAGLREWSGSCEGNFDSTDTSGQKRYQRMAGWKQVGIYVCSFR